MLGKNLKMIGYWFKRRKNLICNVLITNFKIACLEMAMDFCEYDCFKNCAQNTYDAVVSI